MNARNLGLLCFVGSVACVTSMPLGGPAGTAKGPSAAAPSGTLAHADKVDLLLMIDNSSSMADKQELLKQSVPVLVGRLLNPLCVDAQTGVVYGSSNAGACAQGKAEFAPVTDLHVGIVSSSLGAHGGDVCDPDDPSPYAPGSVAHYDDGAHLLVRTRTANGEGRLPSSEAPNGVLAFGPGAITDAQRFLDDLQQLVSGVGEHGCGLEAQMEAWYRFLIQPDPYERVLVDPANPARRVLDGIDGTILAQRRAFLRPDSLVAVVVLTDEDDSAADPLSIGAQGWAYASKRFPGSVGGGAPRGTSACDTEPPSDGCTSCGFAGNGGNVNCQMPGDIDSATNQPQPGYYPLSEDALNVRFFHMRQRYGVDPQFPIARYVVGLSSATVPNRDGEHAPGPYDAGHDYLGTPNCSNPLFSASLPGGAGEETCNLPPGPRSADLVVFAVIGGVPNALLAPPLDDAAWTRIVGRDPAAADYTGIDAHMLQSITPRAGLPSPSHPDTSDPMNGREWDTRGADLQYACTFDLSTARDCNDPRFQRACDCMGSGPNPPLCNGTTQIRGKAYPTIRELAVARALGPRGLVSSICPSSLDALSAAYAYRPALRALGDRMAKSLKPIE